MADKDRDQKPLYDADLPNDEALDEEPEEPTEAEGDEFEGEAAAAAPAAGGRRFGFGRGSRADEEQEREHDKRIGSVRESHERVHINGAPSAIYAVVCAGALIGVLALAWLGGVLPQPATPSYAPLVVPTAKATVASSASASASASASIAPSASTSPVASPSK